MSLRRLRRRAGGFDDGRRQGRLSRHVDRAGAQVLTAPGTMLEVGEEDVRGNPDEGLEERAAALREVYALGAAFGAATTSCSRRSAQASPPAGRRIQVRPPVGRRRRKPGDRVAIIMRNLPEWRFAFGAAFSRARSSPPERVVDRTRAGYGLKNPAPRWRSWMSSATSAFASTSLTAPPCARFTSRGRRRDRRSARRALWKASSALPTIGARLSRASRRTFRQSPKMMWRSLYRRHNGHPKGAIVSHTQIISNMFQFGIRAGARVLRRGEAPLPPIERAAKDILISVPFFHATGCFAI